MKRRDEVLVGVVTLVAVAILIAGSLWLARGGLSSGYPIYARFAWGSGLKQGQPVLFSGVNIGYVDQVELLENGGLVTTLRIYKKQRVPTGTVATIEPNGIFGDMEIQLRSGGPTGKFLAHGDTIPSGKGSAQMSDLLARFDTLETTVAVILSDVRKELIDSGGIASIREMARTGTTLVRKLDSIAGVQSLEFSRTQESLRRTASAVDSVQVDSILRAIRQTATNVNTLAADIKVTTDRVNGILARIESGGGSAARFVNDSTLYKQAAAAAAHLDSLFVDLKANPKRYVSFNFSLFGGGGDKAPPAPKKPPQ